MWLISLNIAFKIANLAIFFIVATIETIVAPIIVSKILLSSQQCHDKPKSNGSISIIVEMPAMITILVTLWLAYLAFGISFRLVTLALNHTAWVTFGQLYEKKKGNN